MKKLLIETAERATHYLASLEERHVALSARDVAGLEALAGPLPDGPMTLPWP